MVTLFQDEILEAIKEWCERRGIPTTEGIELFTRYVEGSQSPQMHSTPNYTFNAQLRGIEMSVKEHPYR